MTSKFVHLHVHTEYSLLDGLSNIKKLFSYVKENGMDSLAITDHGAMYGAIEFYKEAQKQGVKPIIGMEAYTTNVDHKLRGDRAGIQNYHLLLLAKNEEGYKNLMKITSIAHVEGYYYRPRIDHATLEKYSKGLICTSACPQGELAQALIDKDYKKAQTTAKWFSDVFGDDYYLEIQRHHYDQFAPKIDNEQIRSGVIKMADMEKTVNEGVIKLSRELGIPLVATNDSHYIKPEDATAQDSLVCIATGKNVSDIKRLRFIDTPTYYITTPAEMTELFADYPDALANTQSVADKCDLTISTLGKWFFPEFKLPNKKTADGYLRELVYERLPEKVDDITPEVKTRADYELDIITKKGYSPYFLIVMDMVNWANENGIITNTRGSAAGSLVSFCLGITTVDPLKYYLPFERFLNPYRPSPPDIDLDIADDRREELIEYVSKMYGYDKVAQICTFGRMLSRSSVRDVARVLGYEYSIGDRISKLIPPPKQGFPITIPKALGTIEELKVFYDKDSDAKKILDLATQVEGNARHISVHAAGVVVAPSDIRDFTPIQKEPSGEKIITQYEFHTCEDVGLIKFDILGIRNLSILGAAIKIVKNTKGLDIDIHKIPLDDTNTYEMLGRGETMGVFQLSSSGMTKYLIDLKPERVEDLMVMVALYRPGPIAVIPEYIKRKNNPKLIKYLDVRMKKFLEPSYGLLVYQDDLLFCALELAGYSWEEADKFRKAVGKKIPEEMAAQKEKFIGGIITNGQTKTFAEDLWKLFEPFQAYGFNKAHAASYGIVAYQTAYMKANYTVEFMCALLTAESSDTDKVAMAIHECKRMGIKVEPPDINKSDIGFSIVSDSKSLGGLAIRFGLSAIKNVGAAAIEAILETRENGEFKSFAEFLGRVDGRRVNKKVLESLVKVGAMESFGKRSALLSKMDELRSKVGGASSKADVNQQGLFATTEIKEIFKAETFNEGFDEFSEEELQSLERQLLGFSLSAKPIAEVIGSLQNAATHKIFEIIGGDSEIESVKIAGVVTEVRVIITKKTGQEMAFVKVADDTGGIDLVVFPKIYDKVRNYLTDNNPLLISGKVDVRDDSAAIIADTIETKQEADSNSNDNLYIRVPVNIEKEQLGKLKDILLNNPGAQKVTLIFEGKTENRKLDLPIKITWSSQLGHSISQILHGDNLSS